MCLLKRDGEVGGRLSQSLLLPAAALPFVARAQLRKRPRPTASAALFSDSQSFPKVKCERLQLTGGGGGTVKVERV